MASRVYSKDHTVPLSDFITMKPNDAMSREAPLSDSPFENGPL